MKTFFLVLADAVVFLHLLWIVFLIIGAWPGARWAWVKWTHLAALAFSIALQTFDWICPSTDLEIWLRTLGGATPYEGTFIRQYLEPIVYLTVPPAILLTGTALIIAVTLWIYFGKHRAR